MDTFTLRVHIAKMEAKDFWDKKVKLSQMTLMSLVKKMKDYFEKLTQTLTKKS